MLLVALPDPLQVRIDRDEHHWCLTYWLDAVVLRIRITHFGPMDPDEFVCEVRLEGADEFVEVGCCDCAPIEHTAEWPEYPDADEFPPIWRTEFLQLARLWGELTAICDLGPSLGNLHA